MQHFPKAWQSAGTFLAYTMLNFMHCQMHIIFAAFSTVNEYPKEIKSKMEAIS
jgi:hypothetical protein